MEKLDKRYLSQNFRTKFIGSEEVRVTQKSEMVYVVHLILLCVVGNASKPYTQSANRLNIGADRNNMKIFKHVKTLPFS